MEVCELCGAEVKKLEKHHLIPKLKCKKKHAAEKEEDSNLVWICSVCHRTIHAYYPNESELRDRLNSREKLMADEKFAKYIEWRKKHPDFNSNSTKQARP